MSIASVLCRDPRVMQVVVGIITLSKFLTRAWGARSDGGGGWRHQFLFQKQTSSFLLIQSERGNILLN